MAKSGGTRAPGKKKPGWRKRYAVRDPILPTPGSYDTKYDDEIRIKQQELEGFLQQGKLNRRDARGVAKRELRDLRRGNRQGRKGIDADRTAEYERSGGFNERLERARTGLTRGQDTFEEDLRDLARNYDLQQAHAASSANVRGVGGGGTLAAANAIRKAREAEDVDDRTKTWEDYRTDLNQAVTQHGIDTGVYETGYTTAQGNRQENYSGLRGNRRNLLRRDLRKSRRKSGTKRNEYLAWLEGTESQAQQQADGVYDY